MKIKSNITRITKVSLNNDELREAIVNYISSKGVIDTDKQVQINVIDTRTEDGYKVDITISNYNKDNNIYEQG